VQLAVSILIQVMRSSEMVQCHNVYPFAKTSLQDEDSSLDAGEENITSLL
jgi:hypothetical protein